MTTPTYRITFTGRRTGVVWHGTVDVTAFDEQWALSAVRSDLDALPVTVENIVRLDPPGEDEL